MRLLLLFLDEPTPGQVMRNIARSASPDAAARSYRAMVRVLLRQLSGLEDCHLRICYAPDEAHDSIRFWILPEIIDRPDIHLDPAKIDFVPQGPGPRATQLHRAFSAAFEQGYEKIAAIGCDCIELSSRWIHAAFSQLNDRYHAVLGPTPGNGCHLLALRRHHPSLFETIPWGQPDILPAILETAALADLPLYQLPPLLDIHTEADFNKALLGPLGPPLRKAMKALAEDGL